MGINEWGDLSCGICIAIMRHMSEISGLSYGLINILLFVVLGPLSTLVFMASSVISKTSWKYSKKVSLFLDIIGVIIVFSILFPVFYATLTLPI